VRAIAAWPLSSGGARQERAEAHAQLKKWSEATSICRNEPTTAIGNSARSNKQVKTCNICRYPKPLVDFEKTVSSEDERTEACRACLAAFRAMRPGLRVSPSWHLKLTPEEAWERAKSCTKCRLVKELRDFGVGATYKNGIRSRCRSCASRDSGAQSAKVPVDTPQQCDNCNKVKQATEYYLRKMSPTGLQNTCKLCFLENQRVRYVRLKASRKVSRHKKVCTVCAQTKSASEFYRKEESIDGLDFCYCLRAYLKGRQSK
jgi:hypothetical protein